MMHNSDWQNKQKERVLKNHKKTNNIHTAHNNRVAAFHKNHASQLEAGENGNSILARWERFVYQKAKTLLFKA